VAKLILSMDGLVLNEIRLTQERTTIGRRPSNNVVIDNLAVSSEHAVIVTILNDSFLEDLDSTNGTLINGQPVTKHFLQDNDVIELGKYKLKYLSEKGKYNAYADYEKDAMPRPDQVPGAAPVKGDGLAGAEPAPAAPVFENVPAVGPASIQILNGPNAGRELPLTKSLTTLGRPGSQVAVITQRPQAYFITHVEGPGYPRVNGKALGEQPHRLNNHDVFELSGTKMEFFFK
jgi:predicted component of type VI protein secretion system